MKRVCLSPLYFRHFVNNCVLKFHYASLSDLTPSVGRNILVVQKRGKGEGYSDMMYVGKVIHAQRVNPDDDSNHYYSVTLQLVLIIEDL